MNTPALGERLLATPDALLLRQLGQLGLSQRHEDIEELLDEARIVPSEDMPADAVSLGAAVELEDVASGQRHTLVPCAPEFSAPTLGRVSVLSPAGLALMGLRVGDTARWHNPSGADGAARVIAVHPPPQQA